MLSRRFYGMEEVKVDKVPCVSMKLNKVTDVMSITSCFTVGGNINKHVFSKRPITVTGEIGFSPKINVFKLNSRF